jgi:hypothetical protein
MMVCGVREASVFNVRKGVKVAAQILGVRSAGQQTSLSQAVSVLVKRDLQMHQELTVTSVRQVLTTTAIEISV